MCFAQPVPVRQEVIATVTVQCEQLAAGVRDVTLRKRCFGWSNRKYGKQADRKVLCLASFK